VKNIFKDKTSRGNSLDKNPTLSENSPTCKNQDKMDAIKAPSLEINNTEQIKEVEVRMQIDSNHQKLTPTLLNNPEVTDQRETIVPKSIQKENVDTGNKNKTASNDVGEKNNTPVKLSAVSLEFFNFCFLKVRGIPKFLFFKS
jgi:hypothetical protein